MHSWHLVTTVLLMAEQPCPLLVNWAGLLGCSNSSHEAHSTATALHPRLSWAAASPELQPHSAVFKVHGLGQEVYADGGLQVGNSWRVLTAERSRQKVPQLPSTVCNGPMSSCRTWYVVSNLSYMNRVMMLVLPTLWSPAASKRLPSDQRMPELSPTGCLAPPADRHDKHLQQGAGSINYQETPTCTWPRAADHKGEGERENGEVGGGSGAGRGAAACSRCPNSL